MYAIDAPVTEFSVKNPLNESTRQAQTETILTPRFYTTDYDAMDRLDISAVRAEWDGLIAELREDTNKGHFIRTDAFNQDMSGLPAPLRK